MKNVAKPLPVAKMQTGIQGFDEITEGGLPCARTIERASPGPEASENKGRCS